LNPLDSSVLKKETGMFLGHGNFSGNDVVNYHLFSDHVLTLDSSNIAKILLCPRAQLGEEQKRVRSFSAASDGNEHQWKVPTNYKTQIFGSIMIGDGNLVLTDKDVSTM